MSSRSHMLASVPAVELISLSAAVPVDRSSGVELVDGSGRAVDSPERRMSAAFTRGLRKAGGNTVADLAGAWGVGVSRVAQYESGYASPGMDKVFVLAPRGLRWTAEFLNLLADLRETPEPVAPANDRTKQLALFDGEWL